MFQQFPEIHTPDRIDQHLLTIPLVCTMQEKSLDVCQFSPQTSFTKRLAERTCWCFNTVPWSKIPLRCFQQLSQQRILERIDEQIVGDVPPIILNISLPQFMEETVGNIIPDEYKENRTVEQLVGAPVHRISKHILEEDRVAPQMQWRANNKTTDSTSGAWCSFELSASWEFSTHTASRPSLVHVAQGCLAKEAAMCVGILKHPLQRFAPPLLVSCASSATPACPRVGFSWFLNGRASVRHQHFWAASSKPQGVAPKGDDRHTRIPRPVFHPQLRFPKDIHGR